VGSGPRVFLSGKWAGDGSTYTHRAAVRVIPPEH
jgi:hypothetical protein